MSQRLQFSMRALLAGTSVLCDVLGIRHVSFAHLASYVVLEQAKVGQPIRVKGTAIASNHRQYFARVERVKRA